MGSLVNYERRIRALERKIDDLEQICALSFHLLAGDYIELKNEFLSTLKETPRYRNTRDDLRPHSETAHSAVALHFARLI